MRKTGKRLALAAAAMLAFSGVASAQARGPVAMVDWGLWVAPDGCMYWYADGGLEGYMIERVNPQTGLPVCVEVETCLVENADTLFPTDGHVLTAAGREHLLQFFAAAGAESYGIFGHTDSRGSLAYNQALSERRAAAVHAVAQEAGVTVDQVRGFGETRPAVPNDSAANMQLNRRVEIECYRW